MEQLSFLSAIEPRRVEAPQPPTVWDKLAAGLKANELPPITRADVERAKQQPNSKTFM